MKLSRYDVQIYIGSRVGYSDTIISKEKVLYYCKKFCNKNKIAITVTDTHYIYPNGDEPGFIIGLINYPRFPVTNEEIYNSAVKLAEYLMIKLEQFRCSIFTPTDIELLENKFISENMGKDS